MADPTLEDVADRLRKLSDGELMDAMEIIALKFGLTAADRVKRGMNTKKLKVRTGRLRASVKSEVERTRSSIKVSIQAGNRGVPYIFTHEFGATIKAKPGKWLRIPLRRAKTGAGVDRYSSPLRTTAKGKFYAAMSRKKNLILFDRKKHEPWYVLKKQVKVPKAPTLGPAFLWLQKNMIPELEDAITLAMRVD